MGKKVQGLISGWGKGDFLSPKYPQQLCSAASLLLTSVADILSPWEEQPSL